MLIVELLQVHRAEAIDLSTVRGNLCNWHFLKIYRHAWPLRNINVETNRAVSGEQVCVCMCGWVGEKERDGSEIKRAFFVSTSSCTVLYQNIAVMCSSSKRRKLQGHDGLVTCLFPLDDYHFIGTHPHSNIPWRRRHNMCKVLSTPLIHSYQYGWHLSWNWPKGIEALERLIPLKPLTITHV